jgi:hypothetical protein
VLGGRGKPDNEKARELVATTGAPEVVGIGELAIEAAEHQVADLAGGPAYVHLRILLGALRVAWRVQLLTPR